MRSKVKEAYEVMQSRETTEEALSKRAKNVDGTKEKGEKVGDVPKGEDVARSNENDQKNEKWKRRARERSNLSVLPKLILGLKRVIN